MKTSNGYASISKNMSDGAIIALTVAINAVILYIAGITSSVASPTAEMTIVAALGLSLLISLFMGPIVGAEAVIIDDIISFAREVRAKRSASQASAK